MVKATHRVTGCPLMAFLTQPPLLDVELQFSAVIFPRPEGLREGRYTVCVWGVCVWVCGCVGGWVGAWVPACMCVYKFVDILSVDNIANINVC